ncbi:MAG: aminotransferase class III-fold pyridoxal phosphate-dependent enzyme [Aureisphaera sp.]
MSSKTALEKVATLAHLHFGLQGEISTLPGDEDENFKITSVSGDQYIFKISPKESDLSFLEFQNELLRYLQTQELNLDLPVVIPTIKGSLMCPPSENETGRALRVLSWIDGRIWAKCNPKRESMRYDLGLKAGLLTASLQGFQHPMANRSFHWNLADASWTSDHIDLFKDEARGIIAYFQKLYSEIQPYYENLPKSIVHNDVNDYNILVSDDLKSPKVNGIIDFGDAVYTQTINDLAIMLAYAIMDTPDPLEASLDVLKGYVRSHKITEEELSCLYPLVAMRLVTTITKAAIRKAEDPTNKYHVISEKPAWDVLKKWYAIHPDFAEHAFRLTCGYTAHPNENDFAIWASEQKIEFSCLFPTVGKEEVHLLDLKLSSTWIGSRHEFNDLDWFEFKINKLQQDHPNSLIAGGYLEPRPIYTSSTYDKEGNNGPESRAVHLGVDFWLPAGTPVHALFDGEVVVAVNDKGYKEYGGLIILKHEENNIAFYTLHGHLAVASANASKVGDRILKGDQVGVLGTPNENGDWSPHLHFQVMLTLLDYEIDFPGVCYPNQLPLWKSICPDPNLLFKNENLVTQYEADPEDIIAYRNEHLGKGLSISYAEPLHIVRGDGIYLLDSMGRKYLDTVNNVAHVGHEHPNVVKAGQRQMSILNTNTRYLHEEINRYATALLHTFPEELCVAHFVNSGSEANELAIRMAKTVTQRNTMMAMEIGYHGNTNAVIDVSSYKFDGKGGKGKPKNTHILPMPDPYRGIERGPDSGSRYASFAKDIEVAAFIGEPILSCGGQIVPPKNYFKEVYQHVRNAGGLCIADEVQTGFGRVGKSFWAFQLHDVVPDIVTIGKPAGNGHPLAAVICTKEVAEQFANGMEFFNTFGGNPVSCAIGRAVLETIELEGLQKNALETGSYLKSELERLQKEFPIIGEVRGEGLFLGFELVNPSRQPLPNHASYLANRMKELQILMSTDGPDHNVLKIKPPMVFSKENAKELIFRLHQVFSEDFM